MRPELEPQGQDYNLEAGFGASRMGGDGGEEEEVEGGGENLPFVHMHRSLAPFKPLLPPKKAMSSDAPNARVGNIVNLYVSLRLYVRWQKY